MMKITGLSRLFKWENLHNWWLTKYFFAPLYIYIYIYISILHNIRCGRHFFIYLMHYKGIHLEALSALYTPKNKDFKGYFQRCQIIFE